MWKFLDSFYSSRRNSRFGWFSIILVIGANILLFFALSWVNRLPCELPAKERWSAIEVFRAALPPEEEPIITDSAPVIAEMTPEDRGPEPIGLYSEDKPFFKLRLIDWMPEILLKQPDISINAIGIRVDSPGPSNMSGAVGALALNLVDKVPQKIAGTTPYYPFWARQSGAEGIVTLRFVVGVDGKVYDVEVQRVDGDERFAKAAKQAVEKWLFRPAIKAGKPVAAWCIQRIRFKLEE